MCRCVCGCAADEKFDVRLACANVLVGALLMRCQASIPSAWCAPFGVNGSITEDVLLEGVCAGIRRIGQQREWSKTQKTKRAQQDLRDALIGEVGLECRCCCRVTSVAQNPVNRNQLGRHGHSRGRNTREPLVGRNSWICCVGHLVSKRGICTHTHA